MKRKTEIVLYDEHANFYGVGVDIVPYPEKGTVLLSVWRIRGTTYEQLGYYDLAERTWRDNLVLPVHRRAKVLDSRSATV